MRYRAVWLSDFHLGTRACQAEQLLQFLRTIHTDHLYLVGDVVDGWRMAREFYWPESHAAVIAELVRLSGTGMTITIVPGNHDELLRVFSGLNLGKIQIRNQIKHTTYRGKQVLTIHGDQFDLFVTNRRWWTNMFDWLHQVSDNLFGRRWIPASYFGMMNGFRQRAAAMCKQEHCQVIVCGHKHKPENTTVSGIQYINTGDWLESCTYLVELPVGELALLTYPAAPGAGSDPAV